MSAFRFLSNLGYVKTMPRCTLQVIKMQGMSIGMCNMYVQNKQKLQHFFMSACLYIDNQRNAGLKKLIYFFIDRRIKRKIDRKTSSSR